MDSPRPSGAVLGRLGAAGALRDPNTISDEPILAAFDLDGTLTEGSSSLAFLRKVRGMPAVVFAAMAEAPKLGASLKGRPARDRAKEALFTRLMAGQSAAEVDQIGEDFADWMVAHKLRPEMRRRVEWHQRRGHRVVIVSASVEAYVAPIGRRLGVDGVLATQLEIGGDGSLTGKFLGLNCRGPEKLARVMAWAGGSPARLWAYGNSKGDAELLRAADVAVRVGRRALADLPEPAFSS